MEYCLFHIWTAIEYDILSYLDIDGIRFSPSLNIDGILLSFTSWLQWNSLFVCFSHILSLVWMLFLLHLLSLMELLLLLCVFFVFFVCLFFFFFFLTGVKCSVPSLFFFFFFFFFFLKWQPTVDASIPWFWSPYHQPVITRQNEHIDNVNILFDKETNGSVCLPNGDQFLHGAVPTKTESESV